MRFGAVVHGPEVIDTGMTARVPDALGGKGKVMATLGGAMGSTAVLDAGLEDHISILPGQLVSDALVDMGLRCDAVLLLNHSKFPASGLAFGSMVVRKAIDRISVPLVQLDDGFFVVGPENRQRSLWKWCGASYRRM